ncbi:MAG: hypothetical protein JWM11_4675 [Planctomycetaceae bacterium]|nr:hypothetical protein [Planctomycetaceae bacterium]
MGPVPSKYETAATLWIDLMQHKDPRIVALAQTGKRLCDDAAEEWRKRQQLEDFEETYTK